MNVHTLIINQLGTLAQGLSATDRWKAIRNVGGTGGNGDLLWWILIGLGILVAVGTVTALVYAHKQKRSKWGICKILGKRAGLRDSELILLDRMVKRTGLKDPAKICTDNRIFNDAAMDYMSSSQVVASSEKAQLDLQTALVSIHAKLGFGVVNDGDGLSGIRSSRQITTGSRVFVAKMDSHETIEATVTGNSRTELLIRAAESLPGRRKGDILTIRYAHGKGSWEFDARVIESDGSSVVVEHSQEMRSVNFRRFPRISTSMSAMAMFFPFHVDSCDAALEFLPADIVQIAGPGLLIKLPIKVEVGQSMLIRIQVDEERIVQGMTKVRRIVTDKPGGPFLAVEFIELTADELTEMTRATNLAARHKGHVTADVKMVTA